MFKNLARKMADTFVRNLGLTDAPLYKYLGSGDSYSGKMVTPDTALGLAAAYRCIRLISESIAQLPCKVYTTNRQGEASVNYDHPLYSLLHDSPNRSQTAFEYWEAVGQSLAMWGNSYSIRENSIGERVVSLTPVRPDAIAPYRDRETGKVRYRANIDGSPEDFPAEKIFHIKGWGGGFGLTGLSPVALGRHGLGLAMSVEESASKFFSNGLRPSGTVRVDQVLKPEQRAQIKKNMEEYQGSHNAGKLLLLEFGMQYQQLSLPPEDAQMLETRAFNVEEICRLFGVPPFLAFLTEKSTSWGTGLEQQQLGYLIFSLMPYLERIEQACNKWLLPPGERARTNVEFAVEGILRADSAARGEFYAKLIGNSVMTPDEARRKEGLPALGGAASELWMPVNMQPTLGDRSAAPANQPTTERVR
jgi:HK97 family phage portal protein